MSFQTKSNEKVQKSYKTFTKNIKAELKKLESEPYALDKLQKRHAELKKEINSIKINEITKPISHPLLENSIGRQKINEMGKYKN